MNSSQIQQSAAKILWNHALTRAGSRVLGLGVAAILAACQQMPPAEKTASSELLNLSPSLKTQEFQLPYYPNMHPVEISVANSTDAAGGNYGEIARIDLNELFSNCSNYIVANRSLNRQVKAETSIGAQVTPVVPRFILKANVLQVEREIKSDGRKTAWNLVVSTESAKVQREGAVELIIEVAEVGSLTTLFTTRTYGLLYDKTQASSVGIPIVSTAKSTTVRVPERHAIRTACQEAAVKIHDYFLAQNPTKSPEAAK